MPNMARNFSAAVKPEPFQSRTESARVSKMKIEAITLREIQMPLVHFFETSFGRIYSRRILLVTVEGDGLRGWGECVAGEDPFYSSEWIESAWPTIKKYLAPALLGKTVSQGREAGSLLAPLSPSGDREPAPAATPPPLPIRRSFQAMLVPDIS